MSVAGNTGNVVALLLRRNMGILFMGHIFWLGFRRHDIAADVGAVGPVWHEVVGRNTWRSDVLRLHQLGWRAPSCGVYLRCYWQLPSGLAGPCIGMHACSYAGTSSVEAQ